MSIPRPSVAPRARQSIQPTVYCQSLAASRRPSSMAPRPASGSVSTSIHPLSAGWSRSVTSVMSPVRPMPPTVARKSSRSRDGPHSTRRPSATWTHQPVDKGAEGAVAVVVLAVHVACDAAADRHESRPRGHRRKPAAREEDAQHLGERKPGLAGEPARALVEGQHAVGAHSLEDPGAGRRGYRRIAIGAAEPPRQDGVAVRREQEMLGPLHRAPRDGAAAPARDGLDAQPAHREP